MNVLDAEAEQCEQHDDGFLLVPCYVEGDRQVVDIVQAEDFLELESNDDP